MGILIIIFVFDIEQNHKMVAKRAPPNVATPTPIDILRLLLLLNFISSFNSLT